jgi:hypothetical protein
MQMLSLGSNSKDDGGAEWQAGVQKVLTEMTCTQKERDTESSAKVDQLQQRNTRLLTTFKMLLSEYRHVRHQADINSTGKMSLMVKVRHEDDVVGMDADQFVNEEAVRASFVCLPAAE